MIPHQWFIGGVALALGSLALSAAVANYDGLFQLAKMRMLEESMGRNGARWTCGLLGCGLIVVGGLIVAGVLPRKVSDAKPRGTDRLEAYPTAAMA
jgi:hypothetical protein